jgi:hypothetical protein
MTDGRITSGVLEVPTDGDPNGRVTSGVLEASTDGDPNGRVTQVVLEVLADVETYVAPTKNVDFFMHLLPRGAAWLLTPIGKSLRRFWEALAYTRDDFVSFMDDVWADMFPATTRELTAWEQAFGIFKLDLSDADRRTRLDGLWKATGGQSPRYIQDTLQSSGFNAYVHEWWELPATDPPVARVPFTALGASVLGCGDPEMECGEPLAECGSTTEQLGYMLVNKLYTTRTDLTCLCGEAIMECGEPLAECGQNTGIIFDRVTYPVPQDPNQWPYILYIGGATFPDQAIIASNRIEEFEDLLLKICPAQLWIALLVSYQATIIEDATGFDVIEDASSDLLIEVI